MLNWQTNINRFRYFKVLCSLGSVSKAAEALHLSQPSLSVAIKELEQDFGLELFYRDKNRLKLTDSGKVILGRVDIILQQVDDFFNEVSSISNHQVSIVRLGVPPIMGTVLVPKILSDFLKPNPFVELEMFEHTYTESLVQLDENNLDLAIMLYNDNVSKNYNYEIFYDTELNFCISRNNPLAYKNIVSCRELENFPLAILSTGSFHNTLINRMFQEAGIRPHIVYETVQLSTITSLVENFNMGTFIYKDVFSKNPNIVTIPCENVKKIQLCVVWKKNRHLTLAAENVIKFLLAYKPEL